MKLLRLRVENILRVVAVEVDASGVMTVVGGDNEQGKSSVIKALAMALGGKDMIPDDVLHHGAKDGVIIVETDELTVTLTIDATKGPQLVVRGKEDGKRKTAPQTLLDNLLGPFTFDPLKFVHMKPSERLETMRALAGLDFTALNNERARLYAERTGVNGQVTALQSRVTGISVPDGTPDEEVNVDELVAEVMSVQTFNATKSRLEQAVQSARTNHTAAFQMVRTRQTACDQAQAEVARLEQALLVAREAARQADQQAETATLLNNQAAEAVNAAQRNLEAFVPRDVEPLQQRIREAGTVNRNVAMKRQKASLMAELKAAQAKSQGLSEQLDGIDTRKQQMVADAALPVPGMVFGDNDVVIDGSLFGNLSDAAKLVTSVRMGIALMPKDGLRLMLIENGEKLDAKHRQIVVDELKAHGAQCIMEIVSKDPSVCTVVIEDGRNAASPFIDAATV